MESREIFVSTVKACEDLPADARDGVDCVKEVRTHGFDFSYLEFLDDMIRREPRGPEWTARLRKRRAGLSDYCDVDLIDCDVPTAEGAYSIIVDISSRRVVHWEFYDGMIGDEREAD